MTDSRLEEAKIVVFSEASTWKSIPQVTQFLGKKLIGTSFLQLKHEGNVADSNSWM